MTPKQGANIVCVRRLYVVSYPETRARAIIPGAGLTRVVALKILPSALSMN